MTKLCCRCIVATTAMQCASAGSAIWNDFFSSMLIKYMIQPACRLMYSNEWWINDWGSVCRKFLSRIESRNGWLTMHGIRA